MTSRDLSDRLSRLGQPILPSGLTKLDKGERRVDVDDLVALAIALEVSPNMLLLPPEADGQEVELTPNMAATGSEAWAWACGDAPLPQFHSRDHVHRFQGSARPHDPPVDTKKDELTDEQLRALRRVNEAVESAVSTGLHLKAVLSLAHYSHVIAHVKDPLAVGVEEPFDWVAHELEMRSCERLIDELI